MNNSIAIPLIITIVILIIILFAVIFKIPNPFSSNENKSVQQIEYNTIFTTCFVLFIFTICVILLPNFKELKNLFSQIKNVTYTVLYTIFLIFFFTLMPSDIINNYAYIITPISIILSVFIFYKSYSKNLIDEFNYTYERIKTMILFFCFIALLFIYYIVDPGGYINKYFGLTFLMTSIIAVFAFVYLLIVLTLPDTIKQPTPGAKSSNFLENFSSISSYGSILFLIFIVVITIIISTHPGGFFNDQTISGTSIIILLIICILWSILLGVSQFPELYSKGPITNKLNLFKRSLLALFGIVISSLIIYWLVYTIQNFSGSSSQSITSLVLNILLVIIILGLVYKTLFVQLPVGNSNKNAFFSLIVNIIFYIPCIFSDFIDYIRNIASGRSNESYPLISSLIMLIGAIILVVFYFEMPLALNLFNLQGGKQLVNKPVYTNTIYSLGNYEELNGSTNFNYEYAISFWVFLDAMPPNTSPAYNTFTSLLNFGNKPNVLYNAKTNTLIVTMQQKDLKNVTNNKLIDFDDNGNRILYKNDKVLLQKWNNIIINYSGGILDIFLNGELVKSDIGVVPYYTIDNLTIGQENGINGGICNVIYFSKPLNSSKIYYLYNTVKNKTPPVLNESNVTVLKENVNTTITSSKTVENNVPNI